MTPRVVACISWPCLQANRPRHNTPHRAPWPPPAPRRRRTAYAPRTRAARRRAPPSQGAQVRPVYPSSWGLQRDNLDGLAERGANFRVLAWVGRVNRECQLIRIQWHRLETQALNASKCAAVASGPSGASATSSRRLGRGSCRCEGCGLGRLSACGIACDIQSQRSEPQP